MDFLSSKTGPKIGIPDETTGGSFAPFGICGSVKTLYNNKIQRKMTIQKNVVIKYSTA